jgi:TorA maturation chaperone TorD
MALYRFAAFSLADPRWGMWDQLACASTARLVCDAAAIVRGEPSAQSDCLGRGERPTAELDPATVIARLPATVQEANSQYERAFGLLVSGNCPPYETEYIDSKFTFQRSHALADIAGFYHAFGLAPSATHPERNDHLVFELEFMAQVLGLEQAAVESSHPDRLERRAACVDAQRKFLNEHLIWWVPTFARLLDLQDPDGFYGAVSRFLAAMLTAERVMCGLPVSAGEIVPSTVEQPEECTGCLLNTS